MQPSKNNNVDECSLQQSRTNNTESSLDKCSLQQSKNNNTESSPLQHEFIPGTAISLNHPTKTAFTVPKCLTSKECQQLIQFAEDNGFETALLNNISEIFDQNEKFDHLDRVAKCVFCD